VQSRDAVPTVLAFAGGCLVGLVEKQMWVREFLITVIWGTLLPTSYSRTCSRCRVDQGFVLALFFFSFLHSGEESKTR
jgi:hypothetical protein